MVMQIMMVPPDMQAPHFHAMARDLIAVDKRNDYDSLTWPETKKFFQLWFEQDDGLNPVADSNSAEDFSPKKKSKWWKRNKEG
jgi:hypothetical protein